MKNIVYLLIGIGVTLGAGVLYSFKSQQTLEVSYALVQVVSSNEIIIYYSSGVEEKASIVLNMDKIGANRNKGYTPVENVIPKLLEYMHQKGYKVIGESQSMSISSSSGGYGGSGGSKYSYTLIKQN
jgi:hypothetical protein